MKQELKYYLILLCFFLSVNGKAQCWVSLLVDNVAVDTVEICKGDSVILQLSGECVLIDNNFNDGTIGEGWTYVTPGIISQSPCDSSQEVMCAWFGDATHVQRILETIDLDLSPGGDILFDLKYGVQNDPPSCEGPDEMLEGVSLQYSTDHGLTWVDMTYFCPNGTFLPSNPMVQSPLTYTPTQFTSWGTYAFAVPLPAQTPNTRFRWIQSYCSFFNGHYDDNWGVDNVKITRSFSQFIQWSVGNTTLGPVIVNPDQSTTYYVYILGGGSPPDTLAIDSLVVVVHPVPDPEITGDLEICSGDLTLIEAAGPYSYLWSTGSLGDSTLVAPIQTATYYLTSTDNLGCKSIESVTVMVHPLPAILTNGDAICIGDIGTVSASGGVSYQWNTNQSGPQIQVQPDQTTEYTVTVTDQFGCINQSVAAVLVNPLPSLSLTPDTAICYGGEITLTAGGGQQYYWNNGNQTKFNLVSPATNSIYSVTVVDNNGCQNSGSVIVYVSPEYQATIFSDKDTACRGSEITLLATGGQAYQWNTGETSASVTFLPPVTAIYSVTVTNYFYGLSCPAEADILVHVKECSTLYFPNAICPKGYNPVFKPVGDFSTIYQYTLQVFDRWGKLLFESHNPENGWDGRVNGDYYPAGVYVFRVKYTKALIDEVFEKISTLTVVE